MKYNPGIIVRQHLIVLRQMVLLKEQYAESKKRTYAVALQSGLDDKRWADSTECYCYLRNVQDLFSDGETPYDRRFGEPFIRPIIPFGSMLEYNPISARDLSRTHHFGNKVLPRIFLGYALYAGGICKGDILVADTEELENLDASEILARRFKAIEVTTLKKW